MKIIDALYSRFCLILMTVFFSSMAWAGNDCQGPLASGQPGGLSSEDDLCRGGGTSDGGGSGAHFMYFLKSHPRLSGADTGESRRSNFSAVSYPPKDLKICFDFLDRAREGLELIKILWLAAEIDPEKKIFPNLKLEKTSENTNSSQFLFHGNGTSTVIKKQDLIDIGLDRLCDGLDPEGRFELHKRIRPISDEATIWPALRINRQIKDDKGEPLLARNNRETKVIELNPELWIAGRLVSEFGCDNHQDLSQCVNNAKRMIAAHEVLSLLWEHRVENTKSYPLTAPIFVHFNKSCGQLDKEGLADAIREGIGVDTHLNSYQSVDPDISTSRTSYMLYLKREFPDLYSAGVPKSVQIASYKLDRINSTLQNRALVNGILNCDMVSPDEYLMMRKAYEFWMAEFIRLRSSRMPLLEVRDGFE